MEHTQRQIFKGFGSTLPERSTATLTKIVVIRRREILYSVGIYCASGDVAWLAYLGKRLLSYLFPHTYLGFVPGEPSLCPLVSL